MEYLGFCFTRACEWIEKELVGVECHSSHCEGYTARSNAPKVAEVDLQYLEWVVEKPQLTDAARRFLFGERMISDEVIGRLGITSIDKPLPCTRWGNNFFAPGLLIPYRDRQNRLLTVQGRALNRTDESQPRFRFPSGSHCPVYNLPVLEELGMRAVISVIGIEADRYTDEPDLHENYAHCSWEMLREMSESGVIELQNHSYDMHHIRNGYMGIGKKSGEELVADEKYELVK